MKATSLAILTILATAICGLAAPVKEWEIKLDEAPVSGKQVVSCRFTPGETKDYDVLIFECVLRQEYVKKDSSGKERKRTVEPATFTYREQSVRMIEALDKHISFWVPVGVEQVREAFGDTLFVADAPVTIAKIKVTAMSGGDPVWSLEGKPGSGALTPPAAEDTPRDKFGLPARFQPRSAR